MFLMSTLSNQVGFTWLRKKERNTRWSIYIYYNWENSANKYICDWKMFFHVHTLSNRLHNCVKKKIRGVVYGKNSLDKYTCDSEKLFSIYTLSSQVRFTQVKKREMREMVFGKDWLNEVVAGERVNWRRCDPIHELTPRERHTWRLLRKYETHLAS